MIRVCSLFFLLFFSCVCSLFSRYFSSSAPFFLFFFFAQFCFSDMQFDQADRAVGAGASGKGGGGWETTYQSIARQWTAAGYRVPGIVFWNVNGALCKDTPITCDTAGCALMSGFSASLLGVFLRTPIVADPSLLSVVGCSVDADLTAEQLQAQNPLHPLAIMIDSIGKYTVRIDPSEE